MGILYGHLVQKVNLYLGIHPKLLLGITYIFEGILS